MFTFDVQKWVPKFILGDKNGFALAKAIEAAMQQMNDIIKQGIDCLRDYDTMPEWRLDELAWETNCLYDYNAEIETKREWIKNAAEYYAKYGTVTATIKYLEGRFDTVNVNEWWQYDGDPYHFQVVVTGEWSEEAAIWAEKAVGATKNVRSILDGIQFSSGEATIQVYAAAAACGVDIEETAVMM